MHSIALKSADRILTVSKSYLDELLDEQSSISFTPWLKSYRHKLFAITNGISLTSWSPQNSHYLPQKYGLESIETRKKYRQYLVDQFDLDESQLIILFQSRPTSEKGLGIILNEIEQLLLLPIIIVFHADISPLSCEYYFNLKTLNEKFPKRVILFESYREPTAHLLFSACDVLLMPSLHEPCGQLQLYAMQFGLLPVVHKTGGLKETVRDVHGSNPTGWHFLLDSPKPIRSILEDVLKTFKEAPATWELMQKEGMQEDRSWGQRLNAYLELFNFSN
jgi:starch synthase